MSAKNFFSEQQKQTIEQAIAQAELNTSGEVRVHIESKCKEETLDRAASIFHELKMDATALRNGVLFYLAVDDHKFAILGDKGINEKVPSDFWNHIKDEMLLNFNKHKFTEGLCRGIEMAGEKLKEYFPLQPGDTNELRNEVSF